MVEHTDTSEVAREDRLITEEPLEIGDIPVVVATTAAHRGEAFVASRALIDTLKSEVPIWKHQRFGDGTQEWVGAP